MKNTIILSRRLIKQNRRWYFDFTLTNGEEERRYRRDFGINEIDNLNSKSVIASYILGNLHKFIELPDLHKELKKESVAVSKVIDEMSEIKISESNRKHTKKTYKTANNIFQQYLKKKGIDNTQIHEFSKKYAVAFQDYLKVAENNKGRKYAKRTINNRVREIQSLFAAAVSREIIQFNPFDDLKKLRESAKKRRSFTDYERKVVANYILENDLWLYRALLLQFYLGIRPVEITRLQFSDFDLHKGTVLVKGEKAKSYVRSIRTMPTHIIKYFKMDDWSRYPNSYYPFGSRNRPSAICKEDTDTQYKRHKKYLKSLFYAGKLENIEGLTWYSWKDTHTKVNSKYVNPYSMRDQLNHKDLEMTMKYYKGEEIIEDYRNLPDTLHE